MRGHLDGLEGGFGAVVGRLVLMYLPDPVAALARAAELLRPGGLVCLQEGDMAYDWAQPMTPLWVQVRAWFLHTLEQVRVAPRMGLSLHASFIAAGLPVPELRLECAVMGGAEPPAWAWAQVVCGVLPFMEDLGIATAAEVQPGTLAQRLQDEVVAADGVVIGPPFGRRLGAPGCRMNVAGPMNRARLAAGLSSGDGPLSVRVRPSSLKRDSDRGATSTGESAG